MRLLKLVWTKLDSLCPATGREMRKIKRFLLHAATCELVGQAAPASHSGAKGRHRLGDSALGDKWAPTLA